MNEMTKKTDFKSQNSGRVLQFVDSVELAKEVISQENQEKITFTDSRGKDITEENLACAKKLEYKLNNKTRTNYFIRQYNTGDLKGQFYNPANFLETNFDGAAISTNEDKYKWVKVNKNMAITYDRFLITRNSVYYNQLTMEFKKNV